MQNEESFSDFESFYDIHHPSESTTKLTTVEELLDLLKTMASGPSGSAISPASQSEPPASQPEAEYESELLLPSRTGWLEGPRLRSSNTYNL
jgi:hypothetical protein